MYQYTFCGKRQERELLIGFAPRRVYGIAAECASIPESMAEGHDSSNSARKELCCDYSETVTKIAVEESMKVADPNGVAVKTPVSILQELLTRRAIAPTYEMIKIEGSIHEPVFRIKVSFTDKGIPFSAIGAGRSKKEAKQAAARSLIENLTGLHLPDPQSETPSEMLSGLTMETGPRMYGNPIGWLQEMCMSRHWPPPNYIDETNGAVPHDRLFTITCSIANLREEGRGKNKKIAKHLAAQKMWNRLQETPLGAEETNTLVQTQFEDHKDKMKKYFADLQHAEFPSLNLATSKEVSHFYKTLKAATDEQLLQLHHTSVNCTDFDSVSYLEEIAKRNGFEVTFVAIDKKTFDGRFQCIVQLSTLPVGVCRGCGSTQNGAKQEAAESALEYLKIITTK